MKNLTIGIFILLVFNAQATMLGIIDCDGVRIVKKVKTSIKTVFHTVRTAGEEIQADKDFLPQLSLNGEQGEADITVSNLVLSPAKDFKSLEFGLGVDGVSNKVLFKAKRDSSKSDANFSYSGIMKFNGKKYKTSCKFSEEFQEN